MADPTTHCAVYLVQEQNNLWRVQLEYDDGEIFLSNLAFETEQEAMHAADCFIMEYSSNTTSMVH
jgi:CHASE1-domain containing sensor protein